MDARRIACRLFLGSLLLSLAGCETPVFDARACPREKEYSAQHQKQLLADMRKSPPSIRDAMVDYGRLRDQARACRGERVRT